MATQVKTRPVRTESRVATVAANAPAQTNDARRRDIDFDLLSREIRRMADDHERGDIDARLSVEAFEGSYRSAAEAINEMVGGHIAVKRKAMACVDEFSRGNFEAPLERFPGKKAFINDTIERLRSNLKTFIF